MPKVKISLQNPTGNFWIDNGLVVLPTSIEIACGNLKEFSIKSDFEKGGLS